MPTKKTTPQPKIKKPIKPRKNPFASTWSFIKHSWKMELGLLLGIVIVLLGLIGYVRINTVNGTVVGIENKPVKGVEVTLGSTTIETDSQGKFRFRGITQNPVDISIVSKNYQPLTQTLYRGRNFLRDYRIELQPLDYSYLAANVATQDGQFDLALLDGFTTINGESVELSSNEEFNLITENIDTEEIELVIDNPNYDLIERSIDLIPGENIVEDIELITNLRKNVTVLDWGNNSPLNEVTTELGNSNEDGLISFEQLQDFEGAILFEKEGYISQEFTVENLPDSIRLVPEGKIVYSSNRDGVNKIYSSNKDGSDEVKLTDKAVTGMGVDGENVFFTVSTEFNTQEIWQTNLQGEEATKINTVTRWQNKDNRFEQTNIDLKARKIITIVDDFNRDTRTTNSQVISSDLDGENSITIRTRDFSESNYEIADNVKSSEDSSRISYQLRNNEFINSFFGRAGKFLGNKLYDVDIESGEFDVVGDSMNGFESDYYVPVTYSNTNQYLIYTASTGNGGGTKLMIWNNQAKENREITGLNVNSRFINSTEDNIFYVLSQSDKQTNIYKLNAETLEIVQLTDVGGISNFEIYNNLVYYTVSDENKIYLLRENGDDEVLPVSSNGQAWVSFFAYQRFGL